jgi:threonine dehydratase
LDNKLICKNDINMHLKRSIVRTPLLEYFGNHAHKIGKIYLKPENLQAFGSFKIRGIASVIDAYPAERLQHGLAAASAGNMGQVIAFAAQQLNIPCQIFVPDTTPDIKKEKIKQFGAHVIEQPFEQIWDIIEGHNPATDKLLIHPVFCQELLTGYEAIAKEIIEDLPDLDAIVIPMGVGGLSIAMARVISAYNPHIAIYTCEPETAAPLHASLKQGKPVVVSRQSSFVDAIGSPTVLPFVFDQLAPIIRDSVVVSTNHSKKAFIDLLILNKLLCEGASACSLAASVSLLAQQKHQKIVCLLTGGNLATHTIKSLIDEST